MIMIFSLRLTEIYTTTQGTIQISELGDLGERTQLDLASVMGVKA